MMTIYAIWDRDGESFSIPVFMTAGKGVYGMEQILKAVVIGVLSVVITVLKESEGE